jgi:methylmalonyl-CoA/ethylmalonyl-CoA epimerase
MSLDGLDHVALAVNDLEGAVGVFRDILGFEYLGRESVEDMKVETAFLAAGAFNLELLRPTADDSPVSGFLKKRGEGLHHVALKVTGLQDLLQKLRSAGVKVIDPAPRPGAGGKSVAFLHPSSCHGMLVELCEKAG